MVNRPKSDMRTIIFVSHAHEDEAFASAIKTWLEDNLNDSFDFIDVFVSSNRASVPIGAIWFDTLRKNLNNAAICLCLVSPHSIERRWLYFESGATFFKQVPVVPVCLGGVRIKDLRPPLFFSRAIELPSQEGETSLMEMIAKKANRKKLPENPTALQLPEFTYSLSSEFQFGLENLASYESSFKGRNIWVISTDLGLDVVNGPMAGPVSSNLSRGVSYTYFVPRKDDLKATIESIEQAYGESNIPPKFIYLRPDYFDIIETNITIYNPIAGIGAPTEVFFELPVDSDPKERRWIKMDAVLAGRLVSRVRKIIEEGKVNESPITG